MNKLGQWFSRAWLVLVVAGVIILLDQWSKTWVRQTIPDYTALIPIPALGEYFVFEHVHNYGAAFGILQGQGNFFVIVAAVVVVGVLAYVHYLPTEDWFVRVLLGMMLGGAVGNVIDRINLGHVTDFVKMGIPGVYYWPNYNIADSAIVLGVIGLGIYVVVDDIRKSASRRRKRQSNVDEGRGARGDATGVTSTAVSVQESAPLSFQVEAADAGQRLDRWLADRLLERSRTEVQRWIHEGQVQIDGANVRAGQRTEAGQTITVTLPPPPAPSTLDPEAIDLAIIYEDDDLLVIDKPAGMVVHPSPGHESGTLVHAVLHHCPQLAGVGGEQRPGIVHRLDKETSGLIVVAKHDQALRYLQAQFKARTVYKQYLALVEGRMTPPRGRINAPIGRNPSDHKRQMILPPDAVTGESAGREASYRL
jgi:signal peptidase II